MVKCFCSRNALALFKALNKVLYSLVYSGYTILQPIWDNYICTLESDGRGLHKRAAIMLDYRMLIRGLDKLQPTMDYAKRLVTNRCNAILASLYGEFNLVCLIS